MDAKKSKIEAINNRISHNHKCDLRKYNIDGDKKRCTNCGEFFSLDNLNTSGRCKSCWAEEARHRRNNTLLEYKSKIKNIWDRIEEDYFKKGLKKCNTCFEIKPFSEFYNESKSWDGKQNKCIKCTSKYNSSYNPYLKDYNKIKHKEYYDYQRKNNPQFKLALSLRNTLLKKLKQYKINKSTSSLDLIGITIEEFVSYIESKWVEGYMNWENNGTIWELDHIKPISSFDLTDKKQLKECFHFTNYQPLFKLTTTIDGVVHIGNRNKSKKL